MKYDLLHPARGHNKGRKTNILTDTETDTLARTHTGDLVEYPEIEGEKLPVFQLLSSN